MTAADGRQRVDRLDPRLHRRVDVLAGDDPRGDDIDLPRFLRDDRSAPIDRAPERIDHTTDEGVADGDLGDAAGRADLVTLLDADVLAEDDRADGVLLEVEGEAEDALSEVEQLTGHASREAVDAGDPVADLDDGADVHRFGFPLETADLRLDDVGDLGRCSHSPS